MPVWVWRDVRFFLFIYIFFYTTTKSPYIEDQDRGLRAVYLPRERREPERLASCEQLRQTKAAYAPRISQAACA